MIIIAMTIPAAKASKENFLSSFSTSGNKCVAPTYTKAPAEKESRIPKTGGVSLLI